MSAFLTGPLLAPLFDHLWQSTLFAGAAGLLTMLFRRYRASVRYALWFAGLMKFLVPFALLTALGPALYHPVIAAAPGGGFDFEPAVAPFSGTVPFPQTRFDWTPVILAVWAAGVVILMAAWLFRFWQLSLLARRAEPLALDAPMPVKISPAALEPGLIGIFRPVLLLPQGIAGRLSEAEMRAVLAHENCHLSRRDNLMAALQMAVQALFWFYPLVWWLGARLIAERENACDEAVIENGNDPETYADGILKVCRHYLHSPLACASGISGADLKKRMERIMENRISFPLTGAGKLLLASAAALSVAAPIAVGVLTSPPVYAATAGKGPRPGTEAALRRMIESWEEHQPAADLDPGLAASIQEENPTLQKDIADWGALESITFKRNEENEDEYLVKFEHGLSLWNIGPLSDGKIGNLYYSPAVERSDNAASPGLADAIGRELDSDLAGKPAIDIMTPELWATNRVNWSKGSADVKKLGAVKSIAFQRVDAKGWDIYQATFANGTAIVEAPPLVDGKLNGIIHTLVLLPHEAQQPGTEAWLRHYLEGILKGQPDYDALQPETAQAFRKQTVGVRAHYQFLGALKSLSFQGGGYYDTDIYLATFQNGKLWVAVRAPDKDGRVKTLYTKILD